MADYQPTSYNDFRNRMAAMNAVTQGIRGGVDVLSSAFANRAKQNSQEYKDMLDAALRLRMAQNADARANRGGAGRGNPSEPLKIVGLSGSIKDTVNPNGQLSNNPKERVAQIERYMNSDLVPDLSEAVAAVQRNGVDFKGHSQWIGNLENLFTLNEFGPALEKLQKENPGRAEAIKGQLSILLPASQKFGRDLTPYMAGTMDKFNLNKTVNKYQQYKSDLAKYIGPKIEEQKRIAQGEAYAQAARNTPAGAMDQIAVGYDPNYVANFKSVKGKFINPIINTVKEHITSKKDLAKDPEFQRALSDYSKENIETFDPFK